MFTTTTTTGEKNNASYSPSPARPNQSPINIDPSLAQYDPELKNNLKWIATKYENTQLQNTGHGFRVYMETDAGMWR